MKKVRLFYIYQVNLPGFVEYRVLSCIATVDEITKRLIKHPDFENILEAKVYDEHLAARVRDVAIDLYHSRFLIPPESFPEPEGFSDYHFIDQGYELTMAKYAAGNPRSAKL